MSKHFDYGCDVLVLLNKQSKHLSQFNNKVGRIINNELTIKYRLNNHPKSGMYVLLFKPSVFSAKERQSLSDEGCPIYDDENGIPCFTSGWIFKDDEVFIPNKKLMLNSSLRKLAKIN